MLYLLVHVNEGSKTVISERVVSIESANNQFYDLFDVMTSGKYDGSEVQVFIRREKTESWREVSNGLDGDLKMLEILGFLQVKFCLVVNTTLDMPAQIQNRLNAFNILMRNASKPLLPQHRTEYNNQDKLYNEIIEVFQAQKVGWTGGLHDTIGAKFVNCLTNALWYINLHLFTLHTCLYHLPILFT